MVISQEKSLKLRQQLVFSYTVKITLPHACLQVVLSYMTYKIWGHTPSNPTFYFDPAKKTEHNRCDGISCYSVTALFLESLITS